MPAETMIVDTIACTFTRLLKAPGSARATLGAKTPSNNKIAITTTNSPSQSCLVVARINIHDIAPATETARFRAALVPFVLRFVCGRIATRSSLVPCFLLITLSRWNNCFCHMVKQATKPPHTAALIQNDGAYHDAKPQCTAIPVKTIATNKNTDFQMKELSCLDVD